jgi:hypothetical protein
MGIKIEDELLDIEGIKNSNKNLLDLFIRRTAVITSTPEALVEKIIKDQWGKANKATQPSSQVSEIDFCNLGTFYISKAKASKRIKRLENMNKILEDRNSVLTEIVDKRRSLIIVQNENKIKEIKFKTKQLEQTN